MATQKQIEAAYEELRANEVYVNHEEVKRALEAAEAAAWQTMDSAPKEGPLWMWLFEPNELMELPARIAPPVG
jgi:hypothetical protein